VVAVGEEPERDVEVGAGEEAEILRGDADHRVRLAAQREGGAEDPGIAAESALPEAVGEHDGSWRAGLVVIGGEESAGDWLDAEFGKEFRRDHAAEDAFRLAAVDQV